MYAGYYTMCQENKDGEFIILISQWVLGNKKRVQCGKCLLKDTSPLYPKSQGTCL